MSVAKEFREFIARGNVVDLAVGVIIGGAFGAIVKSLVDNVVMPPIGLLMGGVDFSKLELVWRRDDPTTEAVETVVSSYGLLLNAGIQFLIVALVVFLMVKAINSLRRQQAADPAPAEPAPTPSEALLIEIRDLLKAQASAAAAPEPKLTPVAAKKTPPRKST